MPTLLTSLSPGPALTLSSPGLRHCPLSLLSNWAWQGPSCPPHAHSSFQRNVPCPGSHRGAQTEGSHSLGSGCCFAAEKAILLNSAKGAPEQGITETQEFPGQRALTRAGAALPCGSAKPSSETHSN